MIRRRDSLAEFVVDAVQQGAYVGLLLILMTLPTALRVQAKEYDVPDHSPGLDFVDQGIVLEDVQYPSLLAGVPDGLRSQGPA